MKKALIILGGICVILLVGFTYVSARFMDRAKIAQLQAEQAQLTRQRDSVYAFARTRDSLQVILKDSVQVLTMQTSALRDTVRRLEVSRQAEVLSIRRLRQTPELQARVAAVFPEVARSSRWGITELYDEKEQVSLEYIVFPAWFAETFMIDHENAQNYKQQRDRLATVDTLNMQVFQLKDSVLVLEQQKSEAFRIGYDSAYTKYETLNADYIAYLKNPKVGLKFPGWIALVGSAAVGVVVGAAIK
jgi:hypothetical protein